MLSLVNDNIENKDLLRSLGGIKILVNLLKAQDSKLQRAAASALRVLAFRNEDNK